LNLWGRLAACRFRTLGVAFALLLSAATSNAARPIVVFGDSLSAAYGMRVDEGWVTLLGHRLTQEGYDHAVVNASVSGETTAGGRARIARVLRQHTPSVVIVELGANDALRGLPASELEANLTAIVTAIRTSDARVLLVGTPLPSNYGARYSDEIAAVYRRVAATTKSPVVPSLLAQVAPEERNFQADHLHPVPSVEPRMLDAVWPSLRPMLDRAVRQEPSR
jgi:acyl-CoA thioesterase I